MFNTFNRLNIAIITIVVMFMTAIGISFFVESMSDSIDKTGSADSTTSSLKVIEYKLSL